MSCARGPTRWPTHRPAGLVPGAVRRHVQEVMTGEVGVLRSEKGLADAVGDLAALASQESDEPGPDAWETSNLLTISQALTAAASLREETRGSHWREDFPERDDDQWAGHVDLTLDHGRPVASFHPAPATDGERHDPLPRDPARAAVGARGRRARARRGGRPHPARRSQEDLPDGDDDATSVATIPADAAGRGDFNAREPGVVAGLGVAAAVFHVVMGDASRSPTGLPTAPASSAGTRVMTVAGPTRGLLTAERTALNFASHLSGIATATSHWVAALEGTRAQVLDTRKTLPGWRALQKYAVRCGGGVNHRFGLADLAMVKDNHVIAAGGVVPAYRAVRERFPDLPVEVEVTDLDQLRALLDEGCDRILLDNMSPDLMTEAVATTAGRASLEASGGLTLERAAAVAATGVDFISAGALTHSVTVFDLGFDLTEQ